MDSQHADDNGTIPVHCGEFLYISTLRYKDVQQVMVMVQLSILDLDTCEIAEILKIYSQLQLARIEFLEKLNFSQYYNQTLESCRKCIESQSTTLKISELLYATSMAENHLMSNILQEYIFYFKDKIDI